MLSHYPEIFQNNPYGLQVVPDDWKTIKLLEKIKRPSTLLYYGKWIGDNDKIDPPKKHIIAEILQKCDITGDVSLRPYWYGDTRPITLLPEKAYICVQSTKTYSSTTMLNKQWDEESLIEVIKSLKDKFEVIQLGTLEEPRLPNTIDCRNLGISDSATLLANAKLFIGQVGFLMHLARAVDTRSVIIYGGREKAWQSGYPCNENIETSPKCSPCWQNNGCDFNRKCVSDISVEMACNAVEKLIGRLGSELELDRVILN
jgi:ADP-heptose:LPS heptosyltransferase